EDSCGFPYAANPRNAPSGITKDRAVPAGVSSSHRGSRRRPSEAVEVIAEPADVNLPRSAAGVRRSSNERQPSATLEPPRYRLAAPRTSGTMFWPELV